jgi:hypothetical protein
MPPNSSREDGWMGTNKLSEVTILCEDQQQEVFVRAFLAACGVIPRRIRVLPYAVGKGAGEAHVRHRYPEQVLSYRQRANKLNIALVVITDADTLAVADRRYLLEKTLASAGVPPREPDERIALIIPKRNIETWVYFLLGEQVDEETDYPHLDRPREIKEVVRRLADNRSQPLAPGAPPSLIAACDERLRIVD